MYQRKNFKVHGFTLLEILVAMFIFAIVMTTIYATIGNTLTIIDSAESSSDSYQMARIALERMREDLESAYFPRKNGAKSNGNPFPFRGFIGEDMTLDGRESDSIRFSSIAQVNLEEMKSTGISEIAYTITENQDSSFSLMRSDVDDLRQTTDMSRDGLVICDSVQSINYSYYDREGGEHESWNTMEESSQSGLPRMVLISLVIMEKDDPDSLTKFTTSVALPVSKVEND